MQPWKKISSMLSSIWENKQTLKLTKKVNQSTIPECSFSGHKQNFILIWLDCNIDAVNNVDCRNTISQLKQVANSISTFTNVDDCSHFIIDIKQENIFLIISGTLGEIIVPTIHSIHKIHSMYVFCQNESRHRQWAQKWSKVRGVYKNISLICEELKRDVLQCDQNAISIGFVSTNEDLSKQRLDQINQSFIYTQILKEIILTIDFNEQSIKDFLNYCRQQFTNNLIELDNINILEREYHQHRPIWWYTYECFLYSMLNRALRTMEIDTIIKMGFFIRDLHEDIAKLHDEQLNTHHKLETFTVYRGQGVTSADFDQLIKTKGGLLSFNTFLSTSKSENISLNFARDSILKSNLIGVLFVMTIDPSLTSARFASIKNVSYYQTEREILFSMHSIFRVGHIKRIEHDNDRLWHVELKLSSNDDPQRHELTERIRQVTPGLTGWHRLGQFLILTGFFSKAEDLYNVLLEQSHDEGEKAHLYHHFGVIKQNKGEYDMAINFYEKSLAINKEILSSDHHYLASSYSGIGTAYMKKNEYFKALSSHEKALEIFQKTLTPINSHIAMSYGNIGKVYDAMGQHANALIYHEKALNICKRTLSETDPYMAASYYDIGNVYHKMGQLSEALNAQKKALEIREKIFPSVHPLLAASYYALGKLYINMEHVSEGLSFIEHAVDIGTQSLPANHPDLCLYTNYLKRFKQIL